MLHCVAKASVKITGDDAHIIDFSKGNYQIGLASEYCQSISTNHAELVCCVHCLAVNNRGDCWLLLSDFGSHFNRISVSQVYECAVLWRHERK